MADGSIRIPVDVDLPSLKKDIKEMEKELAKTEKKWQQLEDKKKTSTKAEEKIIENDPNLYTKEAQEAWERQVKVVQDLEREQDKVLEQQKQYQQNLDAMRQKYEELQAVADASKQVDKAIADEKFMSGITTQEQYNSLLSQTTSQMAAIEAAAERISAETGIPTEDILAANKEYQKLSDTLGILIARADDFGEEAQESGREACKGMQRARRCTAAAGEAVKDNIDSYDDMGGHAQKTGKNTCKAMQNARKCTSKVGDATKKGIAGFGAMQLKMMALMFAMRAISAATQEYMAVNTELEGQMNTLKALWGQVLGPVIEWVINLLIQAVSAVNAFVYALSGINLVAKANAAALKKQAEAAGGGGNSTAGFDEQTKLSGGSGGSGKAVATLPDGTTMDLSFLDPLMEAIRKFKEDITPLLSTIGGLFLWIWEEILVPFGDWALNGVIPGFLNILGGAFLALNDALLVVLPVVQWIWDNFLQPIAEWTGGVIVDVLNVIGDWIHEHHETLGKLAGVIAVIVGVLVGVPAVISAVGTALAVLGTVFSFLFSPITLIVAAIVGLITLFDALYENCEGFRVGMDQVWQGVKDIFSAAVDFVRALFEGDWAGMDAAWERIEEAAQSLWEGLVEGLKAGWDWCAEKLEEIWEKIVTAFKNFFGIHSPSTVFAEFGGNMMEGLVNGIKNAISKVTNACKEIWSAIKSVFASVGTWFKETFSNAWQKVKDVFSSGGKIFDGIKEGISSTFKTIVNGLIDGINRVIRVPFNAINGMLNTIRSISILGITPFSGLWSYNPLSIPQIPKLALGGIVNRPGRGVPAIIGEAGAEAVLPLENNTEWMDILADKIGGGTITIPITLDGKKIATYVVDIQKKKAFAMNGA